MKFLFNTFLYFCWHSQHIVIFIQRLYHNISELMVCLQGFSVILQQVLWRHNLSILYHSLHDNFVSVEITGNKLWLIFKKKKNPSLVPLNSWNYRERAAGCFNTHYYLEKVRLFFFSKRPFCLSECQALLLQSSSPFNSVPSHIRECERVCFQAQTQDPSLQFDVS